jgi:hypothetical protein
LQRTPAHGLVVDFWSQAAATGFTQALQDNSVPPLTAIVWPVA